MRNNYFSVFVICLLLSGCHSRAPSVNILGAYFPDWMFCILGGCGCVVFIYNLLSVSKRSEWLSPYVLTYSLLLTLFSIGFWAIFFN
ncbi:MULTISPECIES: YtcA family lipoprotein [Serratia]|uniref:YtcA family lipoprotein n=1 Tax=Serratia TaxID=613 RepID=UPI0009B58588|nr:MULTISPECIES: YtcA family lipoprotein [Serratia]MDR8490322.1 YtcA family lipoprotein [Serratia nevei]HAU5647451.1 hypothetical protein [Serratia marcescens]HBB6711429.1 hypothetical protein [Serratia marcescens]